MGLGRTLPTLILTLEVESRSDIETGPDPLAAVVVVPVPLSAVVIVVEIEDLSGVVRSLAKVGEKVVFLAFEDPSIFPLFLVSIPCSKEA